VAVAMGLPALVWLKVLWRPIEALDARGATP